MENIKRRMGSPVGQKKVGKIAFGCIQRSQAIEAAMAPHIRALNALTATARFTRPPFCSCSHSAIVRLAPRKVSQVNSECWSA